MPQSRARRYIQVFQKITTHKSRLRVTARARHFSNFALITRQHSLYAILEFFGYNVYIFLACQSFQGSPGVGTPHFLTRLTREEVNPRRVIISRVLSTLCIAVCVWCEIYETVSVGATSRRGPTSRTLSVTTYSG